MHPAHQTAGTNLSGLLDFGRGMSSSLPVKELSASVLSVGWGCSPRETTQPYMPHVEQRKPPVLGGLTPLGNSRADHFRQAYHSECTLGKKTNTQERSQLKEDNANSVDIF